MNADDCRQLLESSLDRLLKSAVAIGRNPFDAQAIRCGTIARNDYNAALTKLRRAERRRGVDGACNWIESSLAVDAHSSAARGPSRVADDGRAAVESALDALAHATW